MIGIKKYSAETERRHKEYLKWFKDQETIRQKYAAETERRRKESLARHREFEKTMQIKK